MTKRRSENSQSSKVDDRKPPTVSSPAATGGAGNVFERSVGAYWLAQLLVGAVPPILIDCSVTEVHFQTEHLGWHTDDFLVVGQNSGGSIRKLVGQVKRTFTVSSVDEDCKKTIQDFWSDFKNSGVFSAATDRFAMVTQLGTNTLLQHFGGLLECARAAYDAQDFEHRLNTPGFISSTAIRYCDELLAIICASEAREISRPEIWPFLRVLHILSLDLSTSSGQAEAAMKSLLAYTAVGDDKGESARKSWNDLLAVAAEGAPAARSFTREHLPDTVKQRHTTCGVEHPMLTALREHSAIVTRGIHSTIGGTLHLRRAGLVQQVLAALEESQVVVVSGAAGAGKSAVVKDVVGILSRDHFSFSFRAEEFAQPHFDTTLNLGQIPGRAATLTSVLGGQQRKLVLIESVERLLEKSTRDAFADLLTLAASDQTFQIILTCRDYSADLVRTAFLRSAAVDHSVVRVPPLDDDELSEVQAAKPSLTLPLSSTALRQILRNPYILDKALQIRWSSERPLPNSERDFRHLFWQDIVRADHHLSGGMPSRRQTVFAEIALRRARQLSMYVTCSDLDLLAVTNLRADSLLVRSEQTDMLVAPAHDVLEDWAILRWIDEQHAELGGSFRKFSEVLGTHPALRRAYRKWIAELLECDPAAADTFFNGAVHEADVPASFKDDTFVALLRARSAPALIEKHRSGLLLGNRQLLKRMIHLLRVACVTTPAWLQGKAALFNVPDGPAWAALLSIVRSGWKDFGAEDSLLLLGLIEDWAKSVTPLTPYPEGSASAADIAYSLLSHFDDYSHGEERKRTLQVIAKIPNEERVRFSDLLSNSVNSRQERDRVAEELQDIVFASYEGLPAARDVPEVLAAALRNHLLCRESDLRQERRYASSMEIEIYFGLRTRLRHDYFPASAHRTPMLPLLRQHWRIAVDLIIDVFNHSADWYAHPRVTDGLEPAFEVELKFPTGESKRQWCNGRLWNLYRGTSVGPYVLQSYLMALERWLLEVAKQEPNELDSILLELLRRSDNGAVAAVVASVAAAFPFQCGESLLTLLSARDYIVMDRYRLATESQANMEIFGNLLGSRSAENRIYELERKEADSWPHRRQDLESAITNLQLTHLAERVQKMLDEHRQALGDISEQNDDDRLWRLAIHRMDLRGYSVAQDAPIPEEFRQKGYVQLDLKDPDPDVKEIVDRSAPRFARIQNQTSLLMWGLKVFKNENDPGSDPGAWSEKLRAAMSFDTTESQDPMDNMVAGAPGIVAAVCVRDHWQEMSQEEKAWCVDRVCCAVMGHANDWNRMARAQRFGMSPDRSCAWVVSSLLTKDLPESSRKRVEEAFVAALTHAIEEVRWYATWGVAELWPVKRDVASRSVYAIATESSLVMTAMAAEDGKPYDERRPYEEITAEAADRIRKRFWEPDGIVADAYDKLDINDWFGGEAQNRILAILGKAPAEPLAAQAFTRAAQGLVQWWTAKDDRTGRRERNYETEISLAQLLEQSVMRASLDVADIVLQPILNAVNSHPTEVHDIVEGLVLVEDREPNTTQFWALWSLFADRARHATWISRLDDQYARGAELVSALFLGTWWKEEVRHWRSLEGHAHNLHLLFEQLPPSATALDAYVRFLYHVGEQSLPESFIRISKRLLAGDANQMLRKSNTVFMLEVLLQRYVYPKPLELKNKPELRDAVLTLLDLLVEQGSSAAFRMRDDFVTPVSS